jgi:hypothetical protein
MKRERIKIEIKFLKSEKECFQTRLAKETYPNESYEVIGVIKGKNTSYAWFKEDKRVINFKLIGFYVDGIEVSGDFVSQYFKELDCFEHYGYYQVLQNK